MLTRCPGCSKEIPEEAQACPYCKRDFRSPSKKKAAPPRQAAPRPAPKEPVTRCPGCSKEIPESAETCPYCKRDFRSPSKRMKPAAAPAPAAAPPPRREQSPPRREEPDLPPHMLADAEPPAAPDTAPILF